MKEHTLCTFMILHLYASHEARKADVFRVSWSEDRDVGELCNRPINDLDYWPTEASTPINID